MARLSVIFCLIILCMCGDHVLGRFNTKYGSLRQSVEPNSTSHGQPECVCSRIYDPVCGTDENSYYNLCQLQCEADSNVTVVHQGNCIPF